ncbi:hypothetical protein RE428_26640 [Marinobacter nanhaiticus D15-8W]|uniref:AgmX/PglI C-terminal domain-containing protein n=1 Tax=Marinobacter nanhaiticus TaxID=1305740 RepID=UPI0029204E05|nr:hypothetical protein RE428_26640 [Marinobacter nanhaiticus D15-8W]
MGSRFEVDNRVIETADRVDVSLALPWSREPGERRRFAWCLAIFLLLFMPLALIIPGIDLPEPDRTIQERIPPQLAKLIQEKPEPAPKPEPDPLPRAKPDAKSEPKPEPKPEPKQAPAPSTDQPAPPPVVHEPKQTVQQARDTASRSGLMTLQDELSSMHSMADSEPALRMTANVETSSAAVAAQREPDKEDVLASAGVADADGPQEEVELARHQVKDVAAAEPKAAAQPARQAQSMGPGERSMANIRRVFDQQKAVLFALYNRELRRNPALEGEVLLELTIEPDGRVSDCRVVSSELEAPALEQKIVNRVRLFNFGAADVEQRQVRFPIDFLPS